VVHLQLALLAAFEVAIRIAILESERTVVLMRMSCMRGKVVVGMCYMVGRADIVRVAASEVEKKVSRNFCRTHW